MDDLVEDIEETQVEPQGNLTEETQKIEDDKDKNWKAFLEKRKEEAKQLEAEKEARRKAEEDRDRRARELEDLKIAFQAMTEKKDSSNYYEEGNEQNKIIEEKVEQLFSKRDQERSKREAEERFRKESLEIKEQMPDLIDVCSQENIAYLEYYHPEIAIPLAKMPDGFEKTKLAYQAIRKHVKMNKKEAAKIEQNLSKPKSIHSALSNETQKEESSGHLSDKKRNEVWNKMQRLISGEDED